MEAGSAMHEVFAALRICQLIYAQKLPHHGANTYDRIFGIERWQEQIMKDWDNAKSASLRDNLVGVAINTLATGGYYDDPNDDIRTISNMEVASINYIDNTLPLWDEWLIYVADRRDPTSVVGIEQVFDAILRYGDGLEIRFIGTLDGLYDRRLNAKQTKLYLGENKTANRLDNAWRRSFDMSHQVTGYIACGTAVFGKPIFDSRIIGKKIKMSARGENHYSFNVSRDYEKIAEWAAWVRHTVELYELHAGNWEDAPRYTHSCNRYFRPCALIDFCADTAEGRMEQFEQMVEAPLSPSERAVLE